MRSHSIILLDDNLWFPDPEEAEKVGGRRSREDGLIAIGGDLSVERLKLAYRSGIFPWSVNPITWWSPDPRGILELDAFHISRSFARTLRQHKFEITFDAAFERVMIECATQPRGGNWISREFIEAYKALHQAGHVRSVECWLDGELVGGVYGVASGGCFSGESMFHKVSEASKVALHFLVERLKSRGFTLFDTQMVTPVTEQLGAVEISRKEFLKRLRGSVELECKF